MDHLSSCYFCGAALDEPLGVYTVDADDGTPSVTLCGSCRHKLDRLLDANDTGQTVPAEPGPTEAAVQQDPQSSAESETESTGQPEESAVAADENSDETASVADENGDETAAEADEAIDEPAAAADELADEDESTDEDSADDGPAVGETDPTELVAESDSDATEPEEVGEETNLSDSDDEAEPTDAWTPDPTEWGDPADQRDGSTDWVESELNPEPVTTDPEELPDDEEIKEIPGLAVSTEPAASSGWETDIQDEMEPDIPDAFGETEVESAPTTAEDEPTESDRADSAEPEAEASVETDKADEPPEPLSDDGEPAEPTEENVNAETADTTAEAASDSIENEPTGPDEDEMPTADTDDQPEGAIDPSILQADEIASGNADIEEVLDDEIEIPDELATELDDEREPTDSQPTAEPETNGEMAGDTDDPFDLDTGADESGTTESIDPAESVEDAASDSDDGGFDFDNDPGSATDDEDEKLHSEMEAEIPDQFRNDSAADSEEPPETDPVENPEADDDTADEEMESITEEVAFTEEEAFTEGDEPASLEEEIAFEEGAEEEPEAESADPAPTDQASTEPTDPVEGNVSKSDESVGEQRQSISALEYNKVMRLLQNREFPVDRVELMAVAASTYDLSEGDCAEVLDIAIDRGLLAEDGNKLVKPD